MRAYKTEGYEEPIITGGTQPIFTYYHSEKDQGYSFQGMFLGINTPYSSSSLHPCTSIHHVIHPTVGFTRMPRFPEYWKDTVTITRNDRLQLFI